MVNSKKKRAIFMGDSFVYYGNCVTRKTWELYHQCERENDVGYFYQLCRANGIDASVTNWTFGGHSLYSIMSDSCPKDHECKGINHMSELRDKYYDWVIFSGSRASDITAERFLNTVREIIDTFKAVNPNVKFVYLVSSGAHNVSVKRTFPKNVLNSLKVIESWGVAIADWGKLVRDMIDNTVTVEGSILKYDKTTFVVSRTETDGFHPNPLSGYITALMAYCVLTGDSAVGQPYDFCTDGNISQRFDTDFYLKEYYTYQNKTSNYPDVFASSTDIIGIQKLIDDYIVRADYRNYNFTGEENENL